MPTHSPPKLSVTRDVGQDCSCSLATHLTDEMKKPVIQTPKRLPPAKLQGRSGIRSYGFVLFKLIQFFIAKAKFRNYLIGVLA